MNPIEPPATIGVLGGGQLGRYALIAARQMGYRTIVLDPDPAAPAGTVADRHLVAAFDDDGALRQLGHAADVVTTEFENPPAASLRLLRSITRVAPSPESVEIAQDRIKEKAFLVAAGLPVGPYDVLDAVGGPRSAPAVEFPAIVKTARMGYDGRGQRSVADLAELHAAHLLLGGAACVVEQALALESELSVVAARTAGAGFAAFDVAENRHIGGILDTTVVPARVGRALADRAVGLTMAVADALDYVGVLAVELFVVGGELLINEIAPRPHNSGHWTLDAAQTSQFEQQIRAVCGLPLGDTTRSRPAAAMVNLLGERWDAGPPRWADALAVPSTALHLYGKSVPRPGRKMGHITAWGDDPATAATRADAARRALGGAPPER